MTDEVNLVFYDTETTGIQKDFSQILQCGSVLTNNSLDTLAEQNIGCAPLPWVIPQPMAMITNKKVDLFNSNTSHYQMMKDLQIQWKEWSAKSSSIFITYNGHAFDEELVRRQFFWNLLEPYTTNTNGNGRLDLMLMIHNIAAFFSEEISMPLFEGGPGISYKLEHLAIEHGIDAGDAHDAIADCNLMIEMCKIIKDKFSPTKSLTQDQVRDAYYLVKTHDRVGRMADTQEFSNMSFPRQRFSKALIAELERVVPSAITLTDDLVIVRHLYTERMMTPLNLYLSDKSGYELRQVIDDYGSAIKQLAAANIFPGDMLLKNFDHQFDQILKVQRFDYQYH